MSDDFEFKQERARLIERARLEKNWTKKHLAERAGYDEKTLYNLLSGGDVQARTIFDFCQALSIDVPTPAIRKVEVAPDHLGGYSRSVYSDYESHYLIYRPSFSKPDRIYRYMLQILWDEADSGFRFVASYRLDAREPSGLRTHTGLVSIAAMTNLIHFTVTFRGSVRLVTVTKMRSSDGIMRGAMLTHFEDLNVFRPTLAPIIIRRVDGRAAPPEPTATIGFLEETDADFDFAREQLALTQRSVLNLCMPARP